MAPLSNGNFSLLTNMAKHAGLPWDCILSAELARHFKPDKEVYLTAAHLLGLQPQNVMMVAAHNVDLRAAASVGYRTAFVLRRTEYGPGQTTELEPDPTVDVVATDFADLAGLDTSGVGPADASQRQGRPGRWRLVAHRPRVTTRDRAVSPTAR